MYIAKGYIYILLKDMCIAKGYIYTAKGWDPQRARAGPVVQDNWIFGSASSVTELYRGTTILEPVFYAEEYPARCVRCNPLFNYKKSTATLIEWK